ncbi:ribonuclease H-like domain-containing protein [Tanacetum coccineum]
MNEICAKKGIKKEFSMARTPQQNGVAERKNRTRIEAAITMLADSLLPIPFWVEAVNTTCNSPSISFMRPFGCPLTILNTLDSLGKFDGKSDKGCLLGYSTTSKAFRAYNKRTKRVEENLHIDFLEDQPNVAGTGPNWMFDLDFLTNSMNYIPVSVENQVNVDAGTQDSYVAGSSGKDKGPTQEYILLPLQPHKTRIPVEDVAPAAHEKPFESFVDPAHPNKVYKVIKALYGLHQAPRAFFFSDGKWFQERRLISWQCKKQSIVANSTTEAEYVAATNYCGQVLWIHNQMMDYGFNFMNTKIHIDNESTISVIKNPVAHSRTKHIEIRFHFIKDCYEKRLIEVIKVHTDSNVADLLTKGFDVTRFNFLVVSIEMLNL